MAAVQPASPRQLVHVDFWDNNVLSNVNSVVHILDLDFMAERDRIDNIGLVLSYANSGSTLPRDAGLGQRQRQLREPVHAYDGGLTVRLTGMERAAIPLTLARVVRSYTRHVLQRAQELAQRDVLTAWNHRRLGAQRSTRIDTKFVDEILSAAIWKDVLPDRSNDDRAAVQARARHPRGCPRSASSLVPERRGCARPGSAAAFSSGTSSKSRAVLCSALYPIRRFRTPSGSLVSLP